MALAIDPIDFLNVESVSVKVGMFPVAKIAPPPWKFWACVAVSVVSMRMSQ